MMLCFGVAKELGTPLTVLLATEPREVIIGWSCYFGIQNDEQEKRMAQARRR
jgi:hypothetical protein